MAICRLCKTNKELRNSHILPKSFFSKLKSGIPQLIKVTSDISTPPSWDNANWNQKLLCSDCERLMNEKYETSQIAFLRNYKSVYRSHERLTFTNLNFTKFYLLWLSIIWRASESDLEAYAPIDFDEDFKELMRVMLITERTLIDGIDITDIVKIGICKIIPEEGMKAKSTQILTSPILDTESDGVKLYFLVEGFLITYLFGDMNKLNIPINFGEIKKSQFLRVPCIPIHKSAYAVKIFNTAIKSVHTYPNWQ